MIIKGESHNTVTKLISILMIKMNGLFVTKNISEGKSINLYLNTAALNLLKTMF